VKCDVREKWPRHGRHCLLVWGLGRETTDVPSSFVAAEELSELFEFSVETLSEQENIDFDKAIGRACTIKQTVRDNEIRYYNGILTAMRRLGRSDDLFHYSLVLRPWLTVSWDQRPSYLQACVADGSRLAEEGP
jgi:type VI secretion system secreted protein VgrG